MHWCHRWWNERRPYALDTWSGRKIAAQHSLSIEFGLDWTSGDDKTFYKRFVTIPQTTTKKKRKERVTLSQSEQLALSRLMSSLKLDFLSGKRGKRKKTRADMHSKRIDEETKNHITTHSERQSDTEYTKCVLFTVCDHLQKRKYRFFLLSLLYFLLVISLCLYFCSSIWLVWLSDQSLLRCNVTQNQWHSIENMKAVDIFNLCAHNLCGMCVLIGKCCWNLLIFTYLL